MDLAATDSFHVNGVRSPVPVLTESEAKSARQRLESAEAQVGPLHYRHRVELALRSAWDLATHPRVLDAVESCIGPDILLYNATFIIKEPNSPATVAWHQDLTFWGLSDSAGQVSMWLALAPATVDSGCMRMIPGSHKDGQVAHSAGAGQGNILQLDQYIPHLDHAGAVPVALESGEASFHHGWTIHASAPNRSTDRRIGLNVQYLAPHVRFGGDARVSATLVRGQDAYGHFTPSIPPEGDLDPEAVRRWNQATEDMKGGFEAR